MTEYIVGRGKMWLSFFWMPLVPYTIVRSKVTGDWQKATLVGLVVWVLYSIAMPIVEIVVAPKV